MLSKIIRKIDQMDNTNGTVKRSRTVNLLCLIAQLNQKELILPLEAREMKGKALLRFTGFISSRI
jgi:hypothetical protein